MKSKINEKYRNKRDSWICDVCGKEVNDLYFTKNGKEICDSCKERSKK